ncbi:phosphatase PAP2 family protein [Streptomyces hainanensis]|uniref:Phosphatase PAP2 family protein n=1 Tax=Streptomyces hainanensis TaxID=402648 RepID=A0A4R4TMH3_9ACTN|nr:phosphatase PAP2 family protein [Streptomyces hainanensis]TDC77034.1 phosphatase PAP2 family protein [Streptomyces hainanensis]
MPRDRPRLWAELLLIVVVYGAYTVARLAARGDVSTAVDNGLRILRMENALWLHPEVPLNELFTQEAWIGVPSSFAYASLHYIVTPIILIWLFRWRPAHYRLMRTWLLTSTLLGLVGFTLVPTSPPRLLPGNYGFVDSLAQYAQYGWWTDDASAPSGMGDFTNQYAAMPSLHVGWSLWCGVALWHYGARAPWVRALAVGYPLITTIVVMGTANHYFTDAVAGAGVMVLGLLLARPLLRVGEWLRGRYDLAWIASRAARGRSREVAKGPRGLTTPRPRDGQAHERLSAAERLRGASRHNGSARRKQFAPPS